MRKKFLLFGVSVCLAFAVTSCQSTSGINSFSESDLEEATPIAGGEIPPWMMEDGPQVAAGARTPEYFASNEVSIPDETGTASDGSSSKTQPERKIGPAAATASRVSADGYKLYRYTVRKGDDLARIASLSGTSADDIMRLSKLESPKVKAGDVIIVPYKAPAAATRKTATRSSSSSRRSSASSRKTSSRTSSASSRRQSSSSSSRKSGSSSSASRKPTVKHSSTVSYTVKKGDTVESIAKKFGSTSKAVRGATGLSSGSKVKSGQTVRIPK